MLRILENNGHELHIHTNSPIKSNSTLFEIKEKLKEEDKFRILMQVCDSLQNIHNNGFIAGNISPNNIYFEDNNHGEYTVKLGPIMVYDQGDQYFREIFEYFRYEIALLYTETKNIGLAYTENKTIDSVLLAKLLHWMGSY
jgi:serine/threonine protein kinase